MGICGRLVRLVWAAAAVCCLMTAGAAAETAFAWVGDTCGSLSGGYAGLAARLDWIAGHADEESIRFVVHAGDIVCDWEDVQQWQAAMEALGKLDGRLAYSLLAGYDTIGHREESYAPFAAGYAQKRMTDADVLWYDRGIANAQIVDTAQGEILMLSLSCMPTSRELRWADSILAEHEGMPAVLMLNKYLNSGGQTGTIGARIRNGLLQRHDSVRLVLCAHGESASAAPTVEECGKQRAVPVLGLGSPGSPEDGDFLWILRLDEGEDAVTLEKRTIDDRSAETVWTGSTAGWFE